MNIVLGSRRVLVSGSTGGNGMVTARGFLEPDAHVIVNGRSEGSVGAAIEELGGPSTNLDGEAGDLADGAVCADLVAWHPDVDVLVNNVGVFGPQDFFDYRVCSRGSISGWPIGKAVEDWVVRG